MDWVIWSCLLLVKSPFSTSLKSESIGGVGCLDVGMRGLEFTLSESIGVMGRFVVVHDGERLVILGLLLVFVSPSKEVVLVNAISSAQVFEFINS